MCDKFDLQIRNINSNEKIRVTNLNEPTTTCNLNKKNQKVSGKCKGVSKTLCHLMWLFSAS